MAIPSTRDGATPVVEGSNEQSLISKSSGWPFKIRQFWHEVVSEMKRVSWPMRAEVVNTTIIVVIAIFFFAAYLYVADMAFTYLIHGVEWVARKVFV
ncbi:MAG TPA: preprotein translocase subunit SecE [Blastocatellia bacterium]|nr:preprotein translocase subunit SecE [Blastocatellia bacterium]